jgi:hypothetical protein
MISNVIASVTPWGVSYSKDDVVELRVIGRRVDQYSVSEQEVDFW